MHWLLNDVGDFAKWQELMYQITDERDVTDDQRTVRQACHEFLTDLVCSHATGIGFLDNSFATSGR